jgi:hypothetical protein
VKHDVLRSVAHNLADSLCSRAGLNLGFYATDIFEEARKSPEAFIRADLLNGNVIAGRASASLSQVVTLYRNILADVCAKHGASVSHFRTLTARFSVDARGTARVIVTVEDNHGRLSIDEYMDAPLRHIKTIDDIGRVRTQRKPKRG